MKHRQVVVDQTALVAALDVDDPHHDALRRELESLIDAFDRGDVVLVTHSDAVTGATAELARRRAPRSVVDAVHALSQAFDVEVLHADLRDDAHEVMRTARDHGHDMPYATALTVEVARRRGTRRVVSLDPALAAIDLDVVPGQINPA